MTVTKQMLRDKLIFNGPMSLTEVVYNLRLDSHAREDILELLMGLVESKQAELDLTTGLWSSNVIIE